MPEIKSPREPSRSSLSVSSSMMVVAYLMVMVYPAGSCLRSWWLPNRFCYFVFVGASIKSEHNKMLGENERIVWAAVSERTCFMSNAYDAIIVGTGQAGPSLAGRLSEAGMKVAIVERKLFGGTCVNTGCTPTKTMVASAYAAHLARRAADFGVVINGQVGVDMKKVKARKDAVSGHSQKSVESWLKQMQNCTVYQGHARFTSPTEISVGTTQLSAPRIFINVGGRAQTPPMPGLDQVKYLTNSSMMDVDFLPRHLVVIGGSYIGLEFGQMYRRFGSEVTIVEMKSRLIHREDEDVSTAVSEILEREGINVRLNAKCLTVRKQGADWQ